MKIKILCFEDGIIWIKDQELFSKASKMFDAWSWLRGEVHEYEFPEDFDFKACGIIFDEEWLKSLVKDEPKRKEQREKETEKYKRHALLAKLNMKNAREGLTLDEQYVWQTLKTEFPNSWSKL